MNFKQPSRQVCLIVASIFLLTLLIPLQSMAVSETQSLREELRAIQKKIEDLEKKSNWAQDDIDDLSERVDKTEMHTATDKLSFSVNFRTRADSIRYDDIRVAPAALMGMFFSDYPAGLNGATLAQIQGAMGMMPPMAPEERDADNDIIYTNRLRMDMKSKVSDHLSFNGRLAAYKVFGDSTGVKFNQGSLGDVTLDGNTSSLPHGDTIHMERAYFVYKNDVGKVPVNFSLGRRPATDGPPLEYGNYSMVGGSPLATIINWQFDGASLTFGLEDLTGIPGNSFKLCYGVGFESDWGNSSSLGYMQPEVDDVHLFGFISDLYDNGNTSLMFNYAHAWDITDGFTGTAVMPFIISKADENPTDGTDEYYFEANSGGFISRLEPMTNLGDWDAASLLFRTNQANIDLFLAGSWTHTDPDEISRNPFYEMMGMGLLNSNGEMEERDGYSVYAGAVFPMPKSARLGLEYNWGSKYWFNFTGAEDSLIASKLAVRGDVYEAYYIQPIEKNNFFVKLGVQFYDYKYSGSGNPLGEPVEIDKMTALDAINPVVDEVWNYYLSATLNF